MMTTDLWNVQVVLNHDDAVGSVTLLIPIVVEVDMDGERVANPEKYEEEVKQHALKILKPFLNNHAHFTAYLHMPVMVNKVDGS